MKVYALALLVVLTAAVAYHYNALVDERDSLQDSLDSSQREVRRLDAELADQMLAYAQRDRDDEKTQEELADALAEIEDLRGDVASGDQRLRVNATCPYRELPETPATPEVVNGGTVRLTPEAEQDYYALLAAIERDKAKIKGLQRYIQTQCSQDVTGTP